MPSIAASPFRGEVAVDGSPTHPELWLDAPANVTLPGSSRTYREWVRGLPDRRWDASSRRWVITGLGVGDGLAGTGRVDLPAWFAAVGLAVRYPHAGPVAGWSLDRLVTPAARFHPEFPDRLQVVPRLLGTQVTEERLGWGAVHERAAGWFELPVMDALTGGRLRAGVTWPEGTAERAAAQLRRSPAVAGFERFAAQLSSAASFDDLDGGREALAGWLAMLPAWFGMELYPYQQLGALAVALGHSLLADEPGLGKTASALAVAAIRGSARTLIVCPPLVATHWEREAARTGLATAGGSRPAGRIVRLSPRSKRAVALPDAGVVIVPDSLLAARPALRDEVRGWGADVLLYDEAHRAMNLTTARTAAVLDVAASARFCVPITGTPLLASPHQLVPLLEMARLLGPVFGGRDAFLRAYCRQDSFGNFQPRRRELDRLGTILTERVWTRRRKQTVLPWLPRKLRTDLHVDVPLGEYRAAHREVLAVIDRWIDEYRAEHDGQDPDGEAVEAFARGSLGLISQLRRASGLCKIPAATEFLALHDFEPDASDGRFRRPLLVWAHHREVVDALLDAVPARVGRVGAIRGQTSDAERDELVDAFQAGEVAVLVCSIVKAGVGITLTRAQDALFVETDWTPAIVEQAEDRANRIGSTEHLQITTLIATGTVDEHVQTALDTKRHILGAVYGDTLPVSTATGPEPLTATDLVTTLIDDRLARARKGRRTKPMDEE